HLPWMQTSGPISNGPIRKEGSAAAAQPVKVASAALEKQIRRQANRFAGLSKLRGWSTLKYLTQTEVHTYAFSVAANAILSFFPFIVLMLTVTRQVLHSNAMYDVVIQLLRDHLPTGQEFVTHSLVSMAASHRGVKIASLIILLITSTGVFVPLEVALNNVWR